MEKEYPIFMVQFMPQFFDDHILCIEFVAGSAVHKSSLRLPKKPKSIRLDRLEFIWRKLESVFLYEDSPSHSSRYSLLLRYCYGDDDKTA